MVRAIACAARSVLTYPPLTFIALQVNVGPEDYKHHPSSFHTKGPTKAKSTGESNASDDFWIGSGCCNNDDRGGCACDGLPGRIVPEFVLALRLRRTLRRSGLRRPGLRRPGLFGLRHRMRWRRRPERRKVRRNRRASTNSGTIRPGRPYRRRSPAGPSLLQQPLPIQKSSDALLSPVDFAFVGPLVWKLLG